MPNNSLFQFPHRYNPDEGFSVEEVSQAQLDVLLDHVDMILVLFVSEIDESKSKRAAKVLGRITETLTAEGLSVVKTKSSK